MNDRDQVMELLSRASHDLAGALEDGAVPRSACSMARRMLMDAWLLLSEPRGTDVDERRALRLARSMDGLLAQRLSVAQNLRTASDGCIVSRIDRMEKSVGDLLRRTRSMVNKAEQSAGISVVPVTRNVDSSGEQGGKAELELVRGDAQE